MIGETLFIVTYALIPIIGAAIVYASLKKEYKKCVDKSTVDTNEIGE